MGRRLSASAPGRKQAKRRVVRLLCCAPRLAAAPSRVRPRQGGKSNEERRGLPLPYNRHTPPRHPPPLTPLTTAAFLSSRSGGPIRCWGFSRRSRSCGCTPRAQLHFLSLNASSPPFLPSPSSPSLNSNPLLSSSSFLLPPSPPPSPHPSHPPLLLSKPLLQRNHRSCTASTPSAAGRNSASLGRSRCTRARGPRPRPHAARRPRPRTPRFRKTEGGIESFAEGYKIFGFQRPRRSRVPRHHAPRDPTCRTSRERRESEGERFLKAYIRPLIRRERRAAAQSVFLSTFRHEAEKKWSFSEWLPAARKVFLVGEFNAWEPWRQRWQATPLLSSSEMCACVRVCYAKKEKTYPMTRCRMLGSGDSGLGWTRGRAGASSSRCSEANTVAGRLTCLIMTMVAGSYLTGQQICAGSHLSHLYKLVGVRARPRSAL